MRSKEQGRGRTGVYVEKERVGGREHVLSEEGEPQIHLQERTAQDLLVVRQQQLRRVKDCKSLAGEYVTTQHKPVVFDVRMKKWKEKGTMGPKHIKWWKCKDDMMVEYGERVRRKYEELDAEMGTVEGEWMQYKDVFVGGGGGAVL